ncbi:MAG: FAD-dependent oxidoreductase [Sphingomonadaceae bacterium]|nr:FAD-dependent oxidoreductase [Sphingomonadaceae bacterium]
MSVRYDVLIAGGGHAGAQAAIALRQAGFAGTVAIVGDEADPPYERPPLSKDYLAGVRPFERLLIRPAGFWQERGVELLLGRTVVHVDPAQREVATAAGERIGYGALIWAAGGKARRLGCEGGDLAGVHTIRCRADVERLRGEVRPGVRAAVIGGGYIGLESASVLTTLSADVTVLEAQDRVLARVAGPVLSHFFLHEHRLHGVRLSCGVSVEAIEGEGGRAVAVRLAGGERLAADIVIVGIGIAPAVAPLVEAGADCPNGVRVDAYGRTSLAGIYAVGDCALHANAYAGGAWVRLESVQSANDMATAAAKHIAGLDAPYRAVPWFWSDQYDLKLQTVGLSAGHDAEVVRGDPAARSFSVVYMREGRVIALDCVNDTKSYAAGRALVHAGVAAHPALLADVGVPLKSLVPARGAA